MYMVVLIFFHTYIITVQEQIGLIMSQRRIEELLFQVVSINKTVVEIVAIAQVPPVFDTSRLTLPAQISIDMTTGCKRTTYSQEIGIYKYQSNAFKYLDEVVNES